MLKNFTKYIFVFTSVIFFISTIVLLIIFLNFETSVDVKLNESALGDKVSVIEICGKKYVAVSELNNIIETNFEFGENGISIVSKGDDFQIDKETAQKIADEFVKEKWGEDYLKETSVEVIEMENGKFLIDRTPVWDEGVVGTGGGISVIVNKEGRIYTHYTSM